MSTEPAAKIAVDLVVAVWGAVRRRVTGAHLRFAQLVPLAVDDLGVREAVLVRRAVAVGLVVADDLVLAHSSQSRRFAVAHGHRSASLSAKTGGDVRRGRSQSNFGLLSHGQVRNIHQSEFA